MNKFDMTCTQQCQKCPWRYSSCKYYFRLKGAEKCQN